ncbi:MAG: PIG-L family deacetylase [Verrucomicrobiales bacterium]|nr:PIG-L family deacetylase [Verrucomicrobiales bacterium]
MNPFQKFVSEHAQLFQSGKKLPAVKPGALKRSKIPPGAPRALIFSPHPDDECIVGGLALRLLREAKWNVTNVAVTLGSKRGRQAARLRELQHACAVLGFNLEVPGSHGLERINLETREQNRANWAAAVGAVAKILAEHQPRVVFIPHENDGHAAHVGTHFLVLDALKTLPKSFRCFVVETEFWGQMANPNLLVESSVGDVGDLVAALTCHAGEVRRNPYQARLPAWMMDNVRRGTELVGGQGGVAPDFTFATIYRLQQWHRRKLQKVSKAGKLLSAKQNPVTLFR